ncbi:hypothetical protein QOM21_11800 [Streptomyces sp. Pv4-95]|uniref:hypothetical protein n=1 Tax=Streptomyces sp. Pv4-95 TaxID=3049543 RepID=UPI003891B96E
MRQVRRSATPILLLLLAVTFGPLLCRIGGDQAWLAGRAATAAAAPAVGAAAVGAAAPAAEAQRPATGRDVTAGPRGGASRGAPLAVADTAKKCSGRHAPAPDESVPLPAPHRGEPLAPTTAGPAPLAADAPAQYALARPPTDGAPTADPHALQPVLRI